jgi:hypothetical protein
VGPAITGFLSTILHLQRVSLEINHLTFYYLHFFLIIYRFSGMRWLSISVVIANDTSSYLLENFDTDLALLIYRTIGDLTQRQRIRVLMQIGRSR